MKITTISSRDLEVMQEDRTRLCLVRHGELTTSNEWRYVGHLDVELSSNGVRQIEALAGRLEAEKPDVIYCSDLKRTMKSAEIIGRRFGLSPRPHSDFREIHIGRWEGMTMDEITAAYKEEFERRTEDIAGFRVEGGESFTDLSNRVLPCLQKCLDENEGKNILIVAHGGVNRIILCHYLGLALENLFRLDQSYACLNIIDFFGGEPVIRLTNEVARQRRY